MELLARCPNATVNIQASDLGVFARKLVAESRQEFERERATIEAGRAEVFQEPETVKACLSVIISRNLKSIPTSSRSVSTTFCKEE